MFSGSLESVSRRLSSPNFVFQSRLTNGKTRWRSWGEINGMMTVEIWVTIHDVRRQNVRRFPEMILLMSTVILSSCSLTLQRLFTFSFQPFLLCTSSNWLCFVRCLGNCKSPGRNNDLFLYYFPSTPCLLSPILYVSHFLSLPWCFFHIFFRPPLFFPKTCSVSPQSFGLLSLKPPLLSLLPRHSFSLWEETSGA